MSNAATTPALQLLPVLVRAKLRSSLDWAQDGIDTATDELLDVVARSTPGEVRNEAMVLAERLAALAVDLVALRAKAVK